VNVIPGTNAIFATDAGLGFDIFNFGRAEKSLSATSSEFPIPGQKATCWAGFSSKSGNFYLVDIADATITEVNIDKNLNGTIVRVIIYLFLANFHISQKFPAISTSCRLRDDG
jgi:hypothetical protein